jgi:hypothetical protein
MFVGCCSKCGKWTCEHVSDSFEELAVYIAELRKRIEELEGLVDEEEEPEPDLNAVSWQERMELDHRQRDQL